MDWAYSPAPGTCAESTCTINPDTDCPTRHVTWTQAHTSYHCYTVYPVDKLLSHWDRINCEVHKTVLLSAMCTTVVNSYIYTALTQKNILTVIITDVCYIRQYLLAAQNCRYETQSTRHVESYQKRRSHGETGLQAWKVHFLDYQGSHLDTQQQISINRRKS